MVLTLLGGIQMSEDCTHGHTSYSEESYFYKQTQRQISALRLMSLLLGEKAASAVIQVPAAAPQRIAA